jgi:chromosome segregation ATPase
MVYVDGIACLMQMDERRIVVRKRIHGWIAVATLAVAALGWTAQAVTRDGVDNVRATLEKWVEVRRVISKEKQEWVLGKEMLNERIELVQREIASLREKIGQAEASISDADKKRAELVAENDALKSAAATLGGIVTHLEARTAALIQRLPDPIRERIKPLSQRLPTDRTRRRCLCRSDFRMR